MPEGQAHTGNYVLWPLGPLIRVFSVFGFNRLTSGSVRCGSQAWQGWDALSVDRHMSGRDTLPRMWIPEFRCFDDGISLLEIRAVEHAWEEAL